MPRRYVLTGAPGSGKSTLLWDLAARGYRVIEEAATDVISAQQDRGVDEPWAHDDFCDRIVALQRRRQIKPVPAGVDVQIYDRSPLCTLALARFLRRPVTPLLSDEVTRVVRDQIYQRTVFLVCPLGFIQPTDARRISYANSLAFEATHRAVYRENGYLLVDVPAGSVIDRADLVRSIIERDDRGRNVRCPAG